jgi:hypothetical protein
MAVAARDEIDALKAELAAAKTKGKTKGATANDETPPTGAGI